MIKLIEKYQLDINNNYKQNIEYQNRARIPITSYDPLS